MKPPPSGPPVPSGKPKVRAAASAKPAGSSRSRKARLDDDSQPITDARTMRALAHPVRLALIEALGREGTLTATQAAELLGDSPGNMSWHLQTLAKYGYVEETGDGRGRSRPWRVVSTHHRYETASGGPEQTAAGDALEATFMDRHMARMREWWAQRRSYSPEWRQAAFMSSSLSYLTLEEMRELEEGLQRLLEPYKERMGWKGNRPEGSLPIQILAYGHPLPPTPSGN